MLPKNTIRLWIFVPFITLLEEYLEKIRPGADGIILEYKGRGATYLPQVWEQIPDKEAFLESLCNKAGLPGNAWKEKDVKLSRYRVEAFKESDYE